MEKAKYIIDKEKTLFNDLEKSHDKLKEIANWYSLSDYNINFTDMKNLKLFILKVNNIYAELNNLLKNTKQFDLASELSSLIIDKKYKQLGDLEETLLEHLQNK